MLGEVKLQVKLIDKMGSDLTVVNAARVSFAKESEWETIPEGGQIEGLLSLGDEKLIKYLAKHNHWSPFGHASMQFHIKAPIFVARQLVKHQVGLVWNEVSRRYVDYDPEFYTPKVWRLKADNKVLVMKLLNTILTVQYNLLHKHIKTCYENKLHQRWQEWFYHRIYTLNGIGLVH